MMLDFGRHARDFYAYANANAAQEQAYNKDGFTVMRRFVSALLIRHSEAVDVDGQTVYVPRAEPRKAEQTKADPYSSHAHGEDVGDGFSKLSPYWSALQYPGFITLETGCGQTVLEPEPVPDFNLTSDKPKPTQKTGNNISNLRLA